MEITKKICLVSGKSANDRRCFEAAFIPEIGSQVEFDRQTPYNSPGVYNSSESFDGDLKFAGTVTSVVHKISQIGEEVTHVVFVHLDDN